VRLAFVDGLDLTRLVRPGGFFGGGAPATDGTGTFFVPALEAGRYEVAVSDGDLSARKTVRLEDGIEEIDVSLR
jgi:hypothetical protein